MIKSYSSKKESAILYPVRLCVCTGLLLLLGNINLSASESVKCPDVSEIKCKPFHGGFECKAKTHFQKFPEHMIYWHGYGNTQKITDFNGAMIHESNPVCNYNETYVTMLWRDDFPHGCEVNKRHTGFECS